MKKTYLAVATAAVLSWAGNTTGAGIEDELAEIRARLTALEQQVREQDRVIEQKDREIAALKYGGSAATGDAWYDKVEIGGLIEVEAGHVSADGASDDDDLVAGTVELGVAARVNDWVSTGIVLLFEEEADNSDGSGSDIDVDTAVVTIADPDRTWFVNAGQFTLPFGAFPTYMVSDPLTLDVAETADTAVQGGMRIGPATVSILAFDGDRSDAGINKFAATLGLAVEDDGISLNAHLAFLNDVGETDGLAELVANGGGFTTNDDVAGYIASTELRVGMFALVAEYFAALDRFADLGNTRPAAFNIEGAVAFTTAGRPSTFALSYGGTDDLHNAADADGNVGAFTKRRVSATYAVEILNGTTLALELKSEEAYDGGETDTVTGRLAVEF